jgi:hypothetical protein
MRRLFFDLRAAHLTTRTPLTDAVTRADLDSIKTNDWLTDNVRNPTILPMSI